MTTYQKKIQDRYLRNHGKIVSTWSDVKRDSKTGEVFHTTMVEHADGFKRVFEVYSQ